MLSSFSSIAFTDRSRAADNLSRIKSRLPELLQASLPSLLGQVPDPDTALNFLERFSAESPREVFQFLSQHPAALQHALVLFSYSNFLSETLVHQPRLIEWLHSPPTSKAIRNVPSPSSTLEQPKSVEDFRADLEDFQRTQANVSMPVVLARFKRREYLRITLRDVLGLATLAETTAELSHLADVLFETALQSSEQVLQQAYGIPQFVDDVGRVHQARLTILSLGKLGGMELNYSSDVDLVFLFSHEGETEGGASGKISNGEYFVRLSQAVLKNVTEATPEGALFRADLRLRPQGNEGDLAISFPAALEYYRHRARPWELQMLIKARASVGDTTATRNLLLALAPQIYPPATHAPTPEQFAAIEAVVFARQEITRQLRRAPRPGTSASDHSLQWNVKLTPGGIRDIEFLTQCLQRLHGGADTWLSGPATASTLVALQRLHDKGYLSGHDFHCLADAYQFLRLVEHRLQLRDGLQRHTVPDSPAGLDRLGRRCGMEGANTGEQLKHHIAQHFAEVRSLYERIIGPRKESGAALDMDHLFEAPASPGLLPPALRRRFPITFAAAQEAAQLNASARRGLQRLLDAASMEPELMAELESNPTWLAQAAVLFSRSDFAVDHFSRHPKEIAALSEKSESDATSVEQNADQTLEGAIADLRRSFQRQQTRIMVQGLLGKRKPFETFSELSSLAGEALRVSFDLALANVIGDSDAPRPSIAVLALGRLGTQEFDFASDVDLVFVVPGDTSKTHSSVEVARKVVERFVHIVSSHTRDGILFPVDTRLRPLGNEGELVQSSAYLLEYLKTQAHPWEAATYLKARPIAGDLNSGASLVLDIHRTMLDRWRGLEQLAQFSKALAELRTKMEREGTGPKARTEFKHLPGGYYDIEYILAARCFQAAAKEPSPPNLAVNTVEQISALQAINALDAQNAESLRSAANLYRAVDHAHRLITGSGINHDPEPNLARRICVLLDLWGIPLPDGLHAALIAARANCREIYHSIFKSP